MCRAVRTHRDKDRSAGFIGQVGVGRFLVEDVGGVVAKRGVLLGREDAALEHRC